jgi:hypothetical protein
VGLKLVQFLAVVLTALALVPYGAHLFALPNKIGLAQEQYFIAQNIYRGWSLFGIVVSGALIANLVLALMQWSRGAAFGLSLLAFFCIAATLAAFFIWTYPANQATANWTAIPANWESLRRQWEFSHAVNAVITFGGLCSTILSILASRE